MSVYIKLPPSNAKRYLCEVQQTHILSFISYSENSRPFRPKYVVELGKMLTKIGLKIGLK